MTNDYYNHSNQGGCCDHRSNPRGVIRDTFEMLRRVARGAPAVDALYGFLVITLPAGVITYQRPPFRLRACPAAVPGAESAT